jgi:hypothetical protein
MTILAAAIFKRSSTGNQGKEARATALILMPLRTLSGFAGERDDHRQLD